MVNFCWHIITTMMIMRIGMGIIPHSHSYSHPIAIAIAIRMHAGKLNTSYGQIYKHTIEAVPIWNISHIWLDTMSLLWQSRVRVGCHLRCVRFLHLLRPFLTPTNQISQLSLLSSSAQYNRAKNRLQIERHAQIDADATNRARFWRCQLLMMVDDL